MEDVHHKQQPTCSSNALSWNKVIDESFRIRSQSFHAVVCGHFIVLELVCRGTGHSNEGIVQVRVPSRCLDKNTAVISEGLDVVGQEGTKPHIRRDRVLRSLPFP